MNDRLILNRYRPLDVVGKGGSGTVVAAWDTRIQRRVAIKRIPLPKGTASRDLPGLEEARRAAKVSHPNIVSVIDFDTDENNAYLIMEYVDGKSLGGILNENVTLTVDETAAVAKAVSDALTFAHENRLFHLDIKPDNILIDSQGRVKVADFGMAALQDAFGRSIAKGGSIGYMPPEQIETHKVDAKTDQWAFAVVIYECLTGTNPFTASNMDDSVRKIYNAPIPYPSKARPELDPYIDSVLLDAMHADPAIRFASISEFSTELLPLLGKPERGIKSFRKLLNEDEEDTETTSIIVDHEGRLNLWMSLNEPKRTLISRCIAAPCAAWMAWIGFSATGVGLICQIVIALFAAAAGAFAPILGSMLGILTFVAGLCIGGAWIPATIVFLLSIAWWIYFGRTANADSNAAIITPILGVAHICALAPLASGFTLSPKRAICASAMSGLLAIAFACATGSTDILVCGFTMVSTNLNEAFINGAISFAPWVFLIFWVAAAALMSVLCHSSRKGLSIVGAVMGALLIYSGHTLALSLAGGAGLFMAGSVPAIISCVAAAVLMCIASVLGAPLHIEARTGVH